MVSPGALAELSKSAPLPRDAELALARALQWCSHSLLPADSSAWASSGFWPRPSALVDAAVRAAGAAVNRSGEFGARPFVELERVFSPDAPGAATTGETRRASLPLEAVRRLGLRADETARLFAAALERSTLAGEDARGGVFLY